MTGGGNLTLNSPNTFSGPTYVIAGNLQVSNSGALQGSTVTPMPGGYVVLGTSALFGGLSGAGAVNMGGYCFNRRHQQRQHDLFWKPVRLRGWFVR